MNEILQSYVLKTLEWLESGAAWLKEEIPLYVDELLRWKMVTSLIGCFVGLTLMILGIFFITRLRKKSSLKRDLEDEELYRVLTGLSGALSFAGICVAFNFFLSYLKILIAPRVYLIDYFSKMLKM